MNGATKKFTYEVKFAEESSENEFIPRLWATRRVGYLLDEIRLHGENGELRDEVTELARRYGIVTPYTAYLILEDESHREVPMTMRSLQSFDRDHAARAESAKVWNDWKNESAGEKSVADALSGNALKLADAPAKAMADNGAAFNRRYGFAGGSESRAGVSLGSTVAPSVETPQGRLVQYANQSQFVAGKNFFQNNSQWMDSAVQKNKDAKRVRIQFGSPEYFEFAAKNTNALPWLALGQEVQFVIDRKVYEVYK